MLNKIFLQGRLVADPELRHTQSGIAVASFRLAVDRDFKDRDTGERKADFINIVAWRQLGETCARYLSKGRKVGVTGSIQTRSYDAQDGSKRYVTEIVADDVEFLSSVQDNNQARQNEAVPPPPEPMGFAPQANGGFTEVEDDELPF